MKNPTSNSLRLIPAALGLAVCLLANSAKADGYFDVNGTAAGYGIVNGGSYSWDDPNWAAASGGTAATANWVPGSFARFPGGVSGNSYTVTVNNDESMAGLYELVSGVSLTINAAGAGTLDITTVGGPIQGFLVSGSASSVIINAPITGSGGIAPELSGSLYLYGNNTYSGGTALGLSGSTLTYINNNNSFGAASGGISINRGAGVFAAVLATAPVTIANNWTDLGTGDGVNFASSASCPVVCNGTWSVGTSGFLMRNNGNNTSPLTLTGKISGTGGVTYSGANGGRIIVSGANAYSGATTIGSSGATAITLKLGAANTIASSSQVVMAGGTLDPGGFHHAMATTTLSLSDNSVIDFVAGMAELDLANSSSVAWTSGKTLNLNNYTQGTDLLRFGTDGTGLTPAQLAQIEFNGTDLNDAAINSQGYVYDTANPTPIPEPSTALLGLLGGLGALMVVRRRKA